MTSTQAGLAALLIAAVAGTSAAVAQQLPTWPITEICAKEPAQCAAFEARAREAVSGGWGVVPEAYRTACLGEVRTPADRSWRLLSQCIEQQVLKGLDRRAIATSATPAEPVPPPRPNPSPAAETGVPPPPFGVPTTAPTVN